MYVRTIKITFKDKMSKDMFVNYTDTNADALGPELIHPPPI